MSETPAPRPDQNPEQEPEQDRRRRDALLERYRLVAVEQRPPAVRHWWRREGIYLSDVCLAVWVSPTFEELEPPDEPLAQDALYTYLRRIAQTAMDHDYLRPLTCVLAPGPVVPSNETAVRLRAWSAAQDWHRGAYTLYVELPDAAGAGPSGSDSDCDCGPVPTWDHLYRLADLLDPQAKALVLPELKPVTRDQIVEGLKEALDTRPPTDPREASYARELGGLIDDTIGYWADYYAQPQDKRGKQHSPLHAWGDHVASAAARIAEETRS